MGQTVPSGVQNHGGGNGCDVMVVVYLGSCYVVEMMGFLHVFFLLSVLFGEVMHGCVHGGVCLFG